MRDTWKPLHLFNLYRTFLAGVLLIIGLAGDSTSLLRIYQAELFENTSIIYLAFCIVNIIAAQRHAPDFETQVYAQAFVDIIVITLLMHACGGLESGLGLLLFISLIGTNLLIAGQTTLLFAAIAALAVLSQQTYAHLNDLQTANYYTHAGLFGAAYFAVALAAQALASRAQRNEALATQRGIDLENMAQLTRYVIDQIETGIIAVDKHDKIRFINKWALKHLGNYTAFDGLPLRKVSPELATLLRHPEQTYHYRIQQTGTEVEAHFQAIIPGNPNAGSLIFLENVSELEQKAQQLKLAALGKLTASIAHEIRNPLSSINHAAELLGESQALPKTDLRLTEIISDNAKRVNTVIENVLRLSKKQASLKKRIELIPWLYEFRREFCVAHDLTENQVVIDTDVNHATIHFDVSQLHQVLWNLCDNSVHHSNCSDDEVIRLKYREYEDPRRATLAVIDFGAGIAQEHQNELFEPFFTTATKGTGLGLYISKQLCTANSSELHYIPNQQQGSCFQITLPLHRNHV